MGLAGEAKKTDSRYVPMSQLAPTLHYDFTMVAESSGNLERYGSIQTPVLLLGGSTSPAYLKAALDTLEKVLPNVRRVEFEGLNHGGSGNRDQWGKPELVASEVRKFFSE